MKTKLWKIASYAIVFTVGLFLGNLWSHFQDDKIHPRQLQAEIKGELEHPQSQYFFISNSDIKIVPRADGSGILTIAGAGDNTLQKEGK